jgi:murein DD-endopeptidase MepM/ murein hydrolase activator NlpD
MKPSSLKDAATQLESVLLKQVLHTSGVFRGTDSPGSAHVADLFAESLANAVAHSGGLGLANLLTETAHLPKPEVGFDSISSKFGPRSDPFHQQPSFHSGVDIPAPEGTPIAAAKDGLVVFAGERGGFGNTVELRHADGTSTLYAHAREVFVTPGTHVRAGDPIAAVGQTGRSTGPHLHLEVREGGHSIDPVRALKSYRLRAETLSGETP